MRSLTAIIFAVALASGLTAAAGNGAEDKVRDLIDSYIAYIEKAYVKIEPIKLKDITSIPIVTVIPPVGILLSAVNRTVSGFSKNVVTGEAISNNTAQFRVTYPDVKLQSNYKVSGLFYGRRISGEGHATLDLNNVTVDVSVTLRNVDVQYPLTNASYLQIDQLSETFSVGGVATNLTGLTVRGMTQQQVEQLLNAQVITALNLSIPVWEKLDSLAAKTNLNRALIGSSIDDAINWLKKNTPQ